MRSGRKWLRSGLLKGVLRMTCLRHDLIEVGTAKSQLLEKETQPRQMGRKP